MLRGSRLSFLRHIACALVPALGLLGCGASPAVRAAEDGNLVELKRAAADEARRGELDADEARAIARAVASAEAERAAGPVGVERIRELQVCAKHVAGALERRAEQNDAVGAAAALVLLEQELATPEETSERAADAAKQTKDAVAVVAWRAARARSLLGPENAGERRKLLLDGDEGVRVAAIRALLDAADPADTDALIEAARLDPNQLARTLAVRALGAIGGERVVLALKDVWALADEPRRQVITMAWAAPRSINAGGRRELLWAAETQKGALGVAAAIALVRAGGAGTVSAVGVLARAIASGSTRDRVYAINVSPLTAAPIRDAVVKAQDDPDEVVALAAISRRVTTLGAGGAAPGTPERAKLVARLLKIAAPDSAIARRARGSLARARVREVIPMLDRDAQSKDARVREEAGLGFVEMNELGRAAVLAADADPHVRTSVACSILSAP